MTWIQKARHVCILILAFLGFLLSTPSNVRADGVYIPARAYPTLPTIPAQSAVIVYRDGIETLLVESAFQSESPDVAWILPLPAPPIDLKLAESGAITSTAYSLRPDITHDLHGLVALPLIICLMIAPIAMIIMFTRNPAASRANVKAVLMLEFILVLLAAITLPSLGKARSTMTNGVGISILSMNRLGDADFTVLIADSPNALDQWLNAQSMRPLEEKAKQVVADYIAHNWCFIVGHFANPRTELAVPRPLMATFPADYPVFPMKLTALANTTTHVELCVFADQQADADGFHCVAADSFHRAMDDFDNIFPAVRLVADHTRIILGHPDVAAMVGKQCVGTKLVADLTPQKMLQDVVLQLHPLRPYRDHFFTSLSRRQISMTLLLAGAVVFLVIAAAVLRGRRQPTPRQARVLFWSAAVPVFVTTIVCLALPTTPIHAVPQGDHWRSVDHIRNILWEHPDMLHRNMTALQVQDSLQLMVSRGYIKSEDLTNPYTGQPIRAEASPGNVSVRTVKDRVYFCVYDDNGVEQP